ncbi:putative bnr repeat domain-containing protein [Rosellinia necatrix]|uniref:Putative bnr repeat domain-containing protein n=1 Tax=Rosellinia necatrix TaxID=77044 RepID=A0A1W2TWB6_ROSNE|nr:putative bnr repeat domain-containing protein [Rosellinia necatrix]
MRRQRASLLSAAAASALLLPVLAALAAPPAPDTLWQVTPPLDYSDRLYAGWAQVPVVAEAAVYVGAAEGRTYAHHPQLFSTADADGGDGDGGGGSTFLAFSTAPVDEDSMGQDVRLATSADGGRTWSAGAVVLPAALLPNQTGAAAARNFTYYCERGIVQRALQAHAFAQLPTGELYVVGLSASRYCVGGSGGFQSAGRIARRIDARSGAPLGDPCWTEMNAYAAQHLFADTVYGTQYGMKLCAQRDQINAVMLRPDTAPFGSPWLANNALYAADDAHTVGELTHAVWLDDDAAPAGGYWQRFWRDLSGAAINTRSVWVEYNDDRDGAGWYPRVLEQRGSEIRQTNIPDAGSKQYLGTLSRGGARYLVSNPRYDAAVVERQPLTIALSRGADRAYTRVGVLRTNASAVIVPDTRNGIKNRAHGFSYPTAVQVGANLLVAYSENKENIGVSVVDVDELMAFLASH